MAGILLCDETPTVTERAGLFVVEIVSGGERVSFAMTMSAISILAHRSVEAVNALTLRRQAAVVPFPIPKRSKRHRLTLLPTQ